MRDLTKTLHNDLQRKNIIYTLEIDIKNLLKEEFNNFNGLVLHNKEAIISNVFEKLKNLEVFNPWYDENEYQQLQEFNKTNNFYEKYGTYELIETNKTIKKYKITKDNEQIYINFILYYFSSAFKEYKSELKQWQQEEELKEKSKFKDKSINFTSSDALTLAWLGSVALSKYAKKHKKRY